MSLVTRWIKVLGGFEGFHQWLEAPGEVAFLRNSHRHWFEVTVWIQVQHEDRELEFYILKRDVQNWLEVVRKAMKRNWSCEMISDKLAELIHGFYVNRNLKIEVSEDGKEASLCEYSYDTKAC